MDLGESLNPAIDIGQVEGGFIQGLGLFTLEEPLFSPATGQVITRGPSNYKIPTADDIPRIFNVSLLCGSPNPHAIYSSKVISILFVNIKYLFLMVHFTFRLSENHHYFWQ